MSNELVDGVRRLGKGLRASAGQAEPWESVTLPPTPERAAMCTTADRMTSSGTTPPPWSGRQRSADLYRSVLGTSSPTTNSSAPIRADGILVGRPAELAYRARKMRQRRAATVAGSRLVALEAEKSNG